ncbi:hypothetical protein FQR65_LT05748 [Abscondita terminalis]|nr:hypothetical protein FQR65_LT05748 [Abscondita terminalis]
MVFKVHLHIIRQYLAALLVSIGMFVSGLAAGWTGNISDVLLAGEYNNINITITDLEWITSLPTLSALIFSIPAGIMCDSIGRKPTLLCLAVSTIIGWFLIVFANSRMFVFAGRFLIGMSKGPCNQLIPLYNVEIAEKNVRAKFGSFILLFSNSGIFVAFILGYVAHVKAFTIICATISILYFLVLLYQDETPTYKIMKNDYDSARNILRKFRNKSCDVDAEIESIKNTIEVQNKRSLKQSLQKRSTKIATVVTFGVTFFLNTGGFPIAIYYPNEILASSKSSLNPKHATLIIGAIQVLTAMLGSSIIEFFRRRILLITSFLFTSLGLMILGSYFTLRERNLVSEEILSVLGFMPLLGLTIFNLMTAIGVSPLVVVLKTELFPIEAKAVGMSAINTVDWLMFFLMTRFYIDFKMTVGGDVTFYIFAETTFLCSGCDIWNVEIVAVVFSKNWTSVSNKTSLEASVGNMFIKNYFPRFRQYFAALTVSFGMFISGLVVGWTGNNTDTLLAGEYNSIPVTVTDLGWITSLPTLSAMIVFLPIGIICDVIGRRTALLIVSVFGTIGWIMTIFATSSTLLLIGRFIKGIGAGPCFLLIPLYSVEIAENDIRAKLGSFAVILLNCGVLFSFVMSYVTNMKVFTIVSTILSALFFTALLFLDETPTFKIKKNDYDSARKILIRLRSDSHDIDAEIEEIKVNLNSGDKASLKNALQKRSTKIATFVSCGITFFQHLGGTSIILLYTNEIFSSAQASLDPKHSTIILGAVQESFVSYVIFLHISRSTDSTSDEVLSTLGFMPLLGLTIFTIMSSIGVAPIPIILAAELYPVEIKGAAMSVLGVYSWLMVFLVSRFYGDLKLAVGGDVTFYIFAGMCFCGSVFSYLTVPETKNKSLDQIQTELNSKSNTAIE